MTPGRKTPALYIDEETPPAPQQARSVEKRSKLLQAARHLFDEKGYEAASIDEITSRAGTAAGAFYQYFSSKRHLLVVLMNALLQRLSALDLNPQGGADVRTGLYRFLADAFRVDVEYSGVVRAWQEAALADAELGEMQREIQSWTNARVLGVLQLLQKRGNARPDRDLPTFARMMDRHFWSLLARGSGMTPRRFGREIAVATDVICNYLFLDS